MSAVTAVRTIFRAALEGQVVQLSARIFTRTAATVQTCKPFHLCPPFVTTRARPSPRVQCAFASRLRSGTPVSPSVTAGLQASPNVPSALLKPTWRAPAAVPAHLHTFALSRWANTPKACLTFVQLHTFFAVKNLVIARCSLLTDAVYLHFAIIKAAI
jgi:hypothetical protein